MLQRLPGYAHQPDVKRRAPPGWDAYIRTAGVRALHAEIETKGIDAMPLAVPGYGATEFTVTDLNGYVLVFSEFEESLPPG